MTGVEVALIAGAVVSAAGAISAGQAQKSAAKYNAALAEEEGRAARAKAAFDEDRHRDQVERLQSSARALLGGRGIDIEGSPLLALADNAMEGELDALAIRYGGDVAEMRARAEAASQRFSGKQAVTASYFKAGSSLLTGATGVAKARAAAPDATDTSGGFNVGGGVGSSLNGG